MADGPDAREIGRVEDDQGRVIIVGIDGDRVTLRTPLHGLIVALPAYGTEEFGKVLVSAAWQAGWHQGRDGAQGDGNAD